MAEVRSKPLLESGQEVVTLDMQVCGLDFGLSGATANHGELRSGTSDCLQHFQAGSHFQLSFKPKRFLGWLDAVVVVDDMGRLTSRLAVTGDN
jgi:hypothetical protein